MSNLLRRRRPLESSKGRVDFRSRRQALLVASLRQELEQLWSTYNQSQNGVTRVESEYLEVVAIRS